MKISVGICTWNRARLLDQTLEHMRQLNIPQGCDWEVVVVNNNCTDETDDVLKKHQRTLPLRRVFEAQPGKAHAMNAALEAIEGDWILWTDDDVLVDREWITGHLRAVREFPGVSLLGSIIEPEFEVEPPAWLRKSFDQIEGAYAIRRLGDEPIRLSQNDVRTLPYGANFAVRTDVQKAHKFDVTLGRAGSNMVSGEETALEIELLESGHIGYWHPYSKIRHFIPKERLTKNYLRRYFYGIGQTSVIMSSSRSVPLARQLRYFASAALSELNYQSRRPILSSRGRVRIMTRTSFRWGRATATWSATRRAA